MIVRLSEFGEKRAFNLNSFGTWTW